LETKKTENGGETMGNSCNACREHKNEITMVTMSEAAWDRAEERHRREKKALVAGIVVSVALAVVSNIAWLIYLAS
jgi:hypothetical protein